MTDSIVNRVSESGLITLDLEIFLPKTEWEAFDLAPYLFMGQVLKEKDFRQALSQVDWEAYKHKPVALFCSVEAIIPAWAYMLVATYLQPQASEIILATPAAARQQQLIRNIASLEAAPFTDQRVVVKGCGDEEMPAAAYLEIAKKLRPVVRSLMYGEPCSTVPLFKKAAKS